MITLKTINMTNFEECIHLQLKPEQKNFVASNMYSLAEAKADGVSVPYAIYNDDKMVGFIMYDYNPENNIAYITRLMIDFHHQKKGYARKAMEIILSEIKQNPKCQKIHISYSPENNAARQLYLSLGFHTTGELNCGEEVAEMLTKNQKTS